MPTLSITVNRRHLQRGGHLSIHHKQGSRINSFDILAGMDDYQLTLLGITIVLKSSDHSEPLAITTDNKAVASTGQWIISDVDCDMLKEDVEAWTQHRETWRRLFSLLPESVSFHYRGDSPKRTRRSTIPDMAMELLNVVDDFCPGGSVVIITAVSGGKR